MPIQTQFPVTFLTSVSNMPWYLSGGIPAANCVGAWQAIGAASYAASKANLINPGVHDLIDTGRVPAWDTDNGWYGASGKALTTDIVPDKTYTVICRFGGVTAPAGNSAFFRTYVFNSAYFGIDPVPANTLRFWNGQGSGTAYKDVTGITAAGVLALAGRMGYLDGVLKTTTNDQTWLAPPGPLVFLNRSGYDAPLTGNILAMSIYNITLDAETIANLSTRMAALPLVTGDTPVYQGSITVTDTTYVSSIDP